MDLTVMHINKGNAHGTQGERSNPANSNEYRLLTPIISQYNGIFTEQSIFRYFSSQNRPIPVYMSTLR